MLVKVEGRGEVSASLRTAMGKDSPRQVERPDEVNPAQ